MTNREWFPTAKFGMMIHFGVYSLLGGEWRGQRMPFIGEWAQSYFRIPNKEYEQVAKAFNPVCFNAEEWVLAAKSAGMQYMVVTSKHHDGFTLFDTEYDNWSITKATPFGRDMIAEIAEACYKHNLKLGLYYSQALDWHDPNGGGYGKGILNLGVMSLCNNWDYPDKSKKDYGKCFNTKIKTQFKEILTKYGDLCLVWCDTPHDITEEQSLELYNMVKEYQPDALVNSRIGNCIGDYRSCGDNQIDYKEDEGTDYSKAVGRRTGLIECPATLNKTWGFKYYDTEWKDAKTVMEIKNRLNAQNINYLLNVGPDWLGRFPAPSLDILREIGEMQK